MMHPILILHTGAAHNTESCAVYAAGKLHELEYEVLVGSFSNYVASRIHSERTLLICLPGASETCREEVLDFADYLASLQGGDLVDLQFSIFNIEPAQPSSPEPPNRRIDFLLERLGAHRLVPRMDCKSPFHDRLHVWVETIATVLALRQECVAFPNC